MSRVTNHHVIKFLMEFDRFTRKLGRWAFILYEYDFDIVHYVGRINQDANGLVQNPSSS
jgi:hypothetical protein